jgi:nitrogen fixation-related uncharacterized protein
MISQDLYSTNIFLDDQTHKIWMQMLIINLVLIYTVLWTLEKYNLSEQPIQSFLSQIKFRIMDFLVILGVFLWALKNLKKEGFQYNYVKY